MAEIKKEFPSSFGVLEASYDSKNKTLVVTVWNHGRVEDLVYTGVPKKVFLELLEAPSKGGYFNRHIRNTYTYIGKA